MRLQWSEFLIVHRSAHSFLVLIHIIADLISHTHTLVSPLFGWSIIWKPMRDVGAIMWKIYLPANKTSAVKRNKESGRIRRRRSHGQQIKFTCSTKPRNNKWRPGLFVGWRVEAVNQKAKARVWMYRQVRPIEWSEQSLRSTQRSPSEIVFYCLFAYLLLLLPQSTLKSHLVTHNYFRNRNKRKILVVFSSKPVRFSWVKSHSESPWLVTEIRLRNSNM